MFSQFQVHAFVGGAPRRARRDRAVDGRAGGDRAAVDRRHARQAVVGREGLARHGRRHPDAPPRDDERQQAARHLDGLGARLGGAALRRQRQQRLLGRQDGRHPAERRGGPPDPEHAADHLVRRRPPVQPPAARLGRRLRHRGLRLLDRGPEHHQRVRDDPRRHRQRRAADRHLPQRRQPGHRHARQAPAGPERGSERRRQPRRVRDALHRQGCPGRRPLHRRLPAQQQRLVRLRHVRDEDGHRLQGQRRPGARCSRGPPTSAARPSRSRAPRRRRPARPRATTGPPRSASSASRSTRRTARSPTRPWWRPRSPTRRST